MAISFYSENISTPPLAKRQIVQWIKQVAACHKKRCKEIGYLFCNDEKILEINRQYLDHDYFTDIITFDYSEGDTISGDLFISIETVKSNAEKLNQPFDKELYRVIIHGILHLCGIKDKTPEEEGQMRAEEEKALTLLINNR